MSVVAQSPMSGTPAHWVTTGASLVAASFVVAKTIATKWSEKTRPIKVLYIFPMQRAFPAVDTLPESIRGRYEFHFIDSPHFTFSSRANSEFSLVEFIDDCVRKVEKSGIDIVISARDMADLVHSVLATKFEHLSGPSIISSFVTLFKPYTRLLLDNNRKDSLNFEVINIRDGKWQSVISNPKNSKNRLILRDLLAKMGGHGFVKPAAATNSSLVTDFTSEERFLEILQLHSSQGNAFNHYISDFATKYLPTRIDDFELFDASQLSDYLLIEEFMDTPIKVTVDGYVANGQIYILTIVDSIYWTNVGYSECFIGCFLPSNLNVDVCNALESKYRELVSVLISKYGFDNQMIDCEFFVSPKRKSDLKACIADVNNWKYLKSSDIGLKLMEINGRAFMQMSPIYRKVFDCANSDADIISTLLKIGGLNRDKSIEFMPPKVKPGVCGLNAYLTTFESGLGEELFDFEAAQPFVKSDELQIGVEKDQKIETVGQQGSILAHANVTGKDYQACLDRMLEIGRSVVKKGAPWERLLTMDQ